MVKIIKQKANIGTVSSFSVEPQGKWSKIILNGLHPPRGAILKIGEYLYKTRRRTKQAIYVEEYKPIVLRPS